MYTFLCRELLVTDVSHHYQFFLHKSRIDIEGNGVYLYKRVLHSYNKDTFHSALSATDWSEIYIASDT